MKIRQVLSISAILMVLGVGAAQAQDVSAVVMGGDHGKLVAFELDTGGFVGRFGTVGRADEMMVGHRWDWTAGAAWRFRGDHPLSMDLGLDFEPMAPGVGNFEEVDVRGRIGVAWAVNDRASVVVERSRSLHNGTNWGPLDARGPSRVLSHRDPG